MIGPPLWSHTASHIDISAASQGSSSQHWLGTDALGRDIFHRVLVATRLSVSLAALATALGAVVGIPLGAIPSLVGPRLGRLVTGLINLGVAVPALLLAIFVTGIVGVGAHGAVIGIGCAVAPYFARLSQTLAASVAGSDYVAAARGLGIGRLRVLVRHILPNVAEPLLLTCMLSVGESLLALAGLSFLGLGIQPPDYDWGRLLNEGLDRIYVTPVVVLGPAVAIVLAAVTFNLLGEALAKGVSGQAAPGRDPRRLPPPTPAVHAEASKVARPVVDVEDLTVSFPGGSNPVRGVSLQVGAGEIVGIVGESGSGKTLTAMAIADLLPAQARLSAARLTLFGRDPRGLGTAERRRLLGRALAIVYQDPMSTLNPALRVGRQLSEVAEVHDGISRKAARLRSIDRLRSVRIGRPDMRVRQFPFEFSGGMRQRAVIAMGLMSEPQLIVADEPTTALDVTVQGQVLRLLKDVSASSGSAAIVISHDVAVVSQLCSRVLVMYAGRVVEEVGVDMLARGAAHPYTAALVDSVPTMESDRTKPLATIAGRSPGPYEQVTGCPFAPRCPRATERCRAEMPPFERIETGQVVACWHPLTTASPVLEGVSA